MVETLSPRQGSNSWNCASWSSDKRVGASRGRVTRLLCTTRLSPSSPRDGSGGDVSPVSAAAGRAMSETKAHRDRSDRLQAGPSSGLSCGSNLGGGTAPEKAHQSPLRSTS
eukprot:Gregarina_sp_Pseudo_9__5388@NODE_655_length_2421_cov_6_570109_g618_i0_p4_GENE_NODE_655_length_2421_cov_6_570109_g618_i0NODE_655_length_2421_cov_6_570109_g618_i0_p4_ORF_typecomplete_len111_score20_12_NODE_655_length_2421_cov_6_570109_g618_i0220552